MYRNKTKPHSFLKALPMLFLILLFPLLLSGCTTFDTTKSDAAKAEISQNISSVYDTANDTTKIEFDIYIKNNTIYSISSEKIIFRLLKDETFVRAMQFSWQYDIKSAKSATVNVSVVVLGEVNKIEISEFISSYSNLWNSYKIIWILTIIVPIVMAIAYLIIILLSNVPLSEFFSGIWIWIGIAITIPLSCLISYLISSNWFAIILCLIAITLMFLLCLIMSYIKILVDKLKHKKNKVEEKIKKEENPEPQKKKQKKEK